MQLIATPDCDKIVNHQLSAKIRAHILVHQPCDINIRIDEKASANRKMESNTAAISFGQTGFLIEKFKLG